MSPAFQNVCHSPLTWKSLAREQGLSDAAAISLLAALVAAAG